MYLHSMDVKDYMNTHRERMLEELLELLRIPSISADPAYAEHTLKCADVVAEHLRKAGADNVEVVATMASNAFTCMKN